MDGVLTWEVSDRSLEGGLKGAVCLWPVEVRTLRMVDEDRQADVDSEES